MTGPLETIDRREFTLRSLLTMLAGVVITVSGCGSGGSTSPSPTPGTGDKVGSISGNHGHSAVITAAQLTAGGALVLDIAGSAGHSHTVELAAGEVVQIRDGQKISKTSSTTNLHNHVVTFN